MERNGPSRSEGRGRDRPGQDLLDLLSELLAVERDGRRLYADNLRDAPDHMQPKRLDPAPRRPRGAHQSRAGRVGAALRPAVVQADRGGALVDTLGRYLECGGGYDATAAAFNVHRSTVQYRLNRIAEVCGHNLTDPDTTFNLQLATRARETLAALNDER